MTDNEYDISKSEMVRSWDCGPLTEDEQAKVEPIEGYPRFMPDWFTCVLYEPIGPQIYVILQPNGDLQLFDSKGRLVLSKNFSAPHPGKDRELHIPMPPGYSPEENK